MRTTITVTDHLLVEIKQLAARRHTSLTAIIEDSLRGYLAQERESTSRQARHELPIIDDAKPIDGINMNDSSTLQDL